MRATLRDPRVRLLVGVAVVVVALLLLFHLMAMVHGMAMVIGLCLAVLAAGVALLTPGEPVLALAGPALSGPRDRPPVARVDRAGRHPPDEGIKLRH